MSNAYFFPGIKKTTKTIDNIVNESCKYFGVDMDYLTAKERDQPRALVRQMIRHALRNHYRFTFQSIADKFGIDHTTVIAGINRLNQLMDVYPEIREKYNNFIEHLNLNL